MTPGTAATRAPIPVLPKAPSQAPRERRKWTYREGFKYWFDLTFSLVCLPVVLLFGLVVALIIKADSRGPILVKLRRLGKKGAPFFQYKFRTMVPDAELLLPRLMRSDPEIRNEFNASFKIRNDPRITRIGTWLRRTSMDELPQILNVLKGEMSWVGPRAIRHDELIMYDGHAAKLLSEKPGITGLWQVSGRSELSYQERVRLDMKYIESISFTTDAKILLRTIPAVIVGDGAI
jgi:lipopolysaccharide/colanic/teichoic acid biosynthesis glycosyltransferase